MMSATGIPGCSVSPSRMSGICLAEVEVAGAILIDRHQARHRRQRLAQRDALQFALHIDQAAVALLLEHRQLRIGLLVPRLDIGFQLLQGALLCSSVRTFFLASISAMIGLRLTSSSARRTSYRVLSSVTSSWLC